ncbi:MBL fold metallo-hydrolase [Nocardia sp. CDC153]|uniref:MBL fold metallo-hydrolase n=1 Tax=Nocardia sp. CDC153 TaxID=3112167 RepID=UPI002DB91DAC|nr:MBL fold metallo-hydrolase [Nocardia sp. CDC153]MEC3957642.1 MBL fold metallo-hydrolase [Nocardia sp. CDC153]
MSTLPERMHRLGDEYVNFWLLDDPAGVVLIDAGLPRHWSGLTAALAARGRSLADITAVLLTHAHADHLGLAARIARESEAEVWVHADDAALAADPRAVNRYSPSERSLAPYLLRHPSGLRAPLHMLRLGMAWTPRVPRVRTFTDGQRLDLPGNPVAVHTPGHTPGSATFLLSEYGIACTGDTLVTDDAIGGRRGPTAICRGMTNDGAAATRSLRRLTEFDAELVLPGHGAPWTDGLAAAARVALDRGID